jgi:hypothetical protein
MAGVVEMDKILLVVASPCRQRYLMVGVQVFSIKQVLSTDGAMPVLLDRDAIEFRAAHPIGFP